MSSRLMVLDFETTGLDPKKDKPIEIGFILYQDKKVKSLSSFFIDQPELTDLPYEIQKLLGISFEDYKVNAIYDEKIILSYLNAYQQHFDYFVAHFGLQFDELFFKEMVKRNNQNNEFDALYNKPWLDSSIDIVYAEHISTRKLQYIASEFGYVNPYQHRAIFDCIALTKILDHQNIELMIERSKQILYDVQMEIEKPWIDDKKSMNYAKSKGFKFNPESKTWARKITETEFSQENFDYPVKILKEEKRNEPRLD